MYHYFEERMCMTPASGREHYHNAHAGGDVEHVIHVTNLALQIKELWKKNILILGFGRIGKNLIKKCIGFDMNVFVYDPFIDKKTINDLGGKKIF